LGTYSTIIVIDSLLKTEEIESTIEKVQRSITNNGGEIMEIDRWGKKRLAYEIKKRQYGYYVEIVFKASGDLIKVIEREYSLDENVLRSLTTMIDSKAWEFRNKKTKKADKEVVKKENDDISVDNNDDTKTEVKEEVKEEIKEEIATEKEEKIVENK
jgi:small subunit ribosomal protein S6